ncbi:MAG: GHKL domain-containing protein [Clostridiales bacterium]|nr:GHKL domain-containing protein [Clostridiales bacterium]
MKPLKKPVSVRKATNYAIVINALQIALILVMLLAIIIVPEIETSYRLLLTLTIVASLVIVWGAVVDIREALHTRKLLTQLDDMDDTIDAMSQFNNTLRAQRHDFLNHLQVVYSLIEMEEYQEANDYIEQVYGRITSVSRVVKTANPAVNALLMVKTAACEKAGVPVEVSITSKWETLENAMPDWEMCKVLSNLIDNAIDAMERVPQGQRRLLIALGENVRQYTFLVENTGEKIPETIREHIFIPGFTTKGDGHGMGLHIVRRTLHERGGDIQVESDDKHTVFSGYVPKVNLHTEPTA